MKAINQSPRRNRLSKVFLAALVPFLFAFALLLAVPSSGQAMPPEPIERTPLPGVRTPTPRPYPIPTNGFNWSMAPRFGP